MRTFTDIEDDEIAKLFLAGKIGVVRTDTLYGVLAKADDEHAVQRVYEAKGRSDKKSPIVLISSTNQLFDEVSDEQRELLDDVWPGKVSVILPSLKAPEWIRRGNASVAYRLPDDEKLRVLLEKTGPLIAPSANPQGETPAMTINEAIEYFGDDIDFYVDGGNVIDGTPSTLLRITDSGEVERLR